MRFEKSRNIATSRLTLLSYHDDYPHRYDRPARVQVSHMTDMIAVLFQFRSEITQAHKDLFVSSLKKLKDMSCVKDHRLLVGGPSITEPIERSKGFQYALLSYHQDLEALATYQGSAEHHE